MEPYLRCRPSPTGGTNLKPHNNCIACAETPLGVVMFLPRTECSCLCFVYQRQALRSKGNRSKRLAIAYTNSGAAIPWPLFSHRKSCLVSKFHGTGKCCGLLLSEKSCLQNNVQYKNNCGKCMYISRETLEGYTLKCKY